MVTPADLRIRFTPDDAELSRLHAAAFGTSNAVIQPWRERLERHALTWVVHPAHQRQGLGRTVVGAAVRQATRAGCEWLHVDYEPGLTGFYREACGFAPTEAGLLRLRG